MAGLFRAAVEAANGGDAAVQLDDLGTAALLMQTVDVLGNQLGEMTERLKPGEGAMGGFGRAPAMSGQPAMLRAQ